VSARIRLSDVQSAERPHPQPGIDAMMACASAKVRSKSALSPGRMLSIATSKIVLYSFR
jgi:hypothetical protein